MNIKKKKSRTTVIAEALYKRWWDDRVVRPEQIAFWIPFARAVERALYKHEKTGAKFLYHRAKSGPRGGK